MITEKQGTGAASGTTVTVDLATGNFFEIDLQDASGDIATFTINNAAAAHRSSFVLKITQGSTARTFSSPFSGADIKWAGSGFRGGTFVASDSGMDMLLTSNNHGLKLGEAFRVTTTGTFPAGGPGGSSSVFFRTDTDFYVYWDSVSCGQSTGLTTNTWKVARHPYANDPTATQGCPLYFENAGSGTHSWYTSRVTTTNNAVDILTFRTFDNGTTWHGTIVGQNYS